MLAAHERREAARLRFAHDRRRFLVRRGLLRAILARYVGGDPAELAFVHGAHGKPALAYGEVQFSTSHSGDLALYAVSGNRRLGVDVERLRPVPGALSIARCLFAPSEVAALEELPDDERDEAFLRCWVRKEAYVKGRGEGLACPLDSFAVGAGRVTPAGRACMEGDGGTMPSRWWLTSVSPVTGYVAALAAELQAPAKSSGNAEPRITLLTPSFRMLAAGRLEAAAAHPGENDEPAREARPGSDRREG